MATLACQQRCIRRAGSWSDQPLRPPGVLDREEPTGCPACASTTSIEPVAWRVQRRHGSYAIDSQTPLRSCLLACPRSGTGPDRCRHPCSQRYLHALSQGVLGRGSRRGVLAWRQGAACVLARSSVAVRRHVRRVAYGSSGRGGTCALHAIGSAGSDASSGSRPAGVGLGASATVVTS